MPVANNAWSGWAVEGGTLEVRGRWGDWDDRHSNVLTSVHLAREEGGPNLDEGGREWQRREINLRFVLINWPKLALFGGRRGAQTSRHRLELRQGFSGKLPRRECGSMERERNGREKTQARLGRVLSQLPLSVCSAFAQRKSKIPRVQELSFSAKKLNLKRNCIIFRRNLGHTL